MAIKTWRVKFAGREIQAKLAKADAEHLANRLHRLEDVREWSEETTGIVGGESFTCQVWAAVISRAHKDDPLENEAAFAEDMAAFLASIPDMIDKTTAPGIVATANALFAKYIRKVDKRQTPEEKAADMARYHQADESNRARMAETERAYCEKYGASIEKVPIPDGMMGIYLSVNFDDSDIMTDYFNNHCSIGPDMLLAIVPRQPETERLARLTLAKYPELAALDWKWDSHKYSMGHGNWLQSGVIGTEKRTAYDHREEVSVWYEVEFSHGTREMHTAKGYPGLTDPAPLPKATTDGGAVTVRRNEAHNGIEVIFAEKPDAAIMDTLKRWGFRWSRFQGLWYRHYDRPRFEEVTAWALTLQGTASGASESPAPVPTLENCDNCHYQECEYKSDPADVVKNSCKAWAPIEAPAVSLSASDRIVTHEANLTVHMMPGQTPYTPEEYAAVCSLVSAAAAEDPGEDMEHRLLSPQS